MPQFSLGGGFRGCEHRDSMGSVSRLVESDRPRNRPRRGRGRSHPPKSWHAELRRQLGRLLLQALSMLSPGSSVSIHSRGMSATVAFSKPA
jgi:hypothetical protein